MLKQLILMATISGLAQAAQAHCDRDCMMRLTDQYPALAAAARLSR